MAKHPARCPKCGNFLEFDTAADEQIICSGCQVLLSLPGKFRHSDKVDPLIGQRLGEFEIVDLLGRGGMGCVYKARQPSLGRFVAVKILPRAVSRDSSFVERFGREARDAAAVNHPNIIQIYAVGQDKGYQFIAMEIVDGESLADLLKREGPLPADRALDLMKQIAAALAKAHAAGIVHRDIKPSNILLTPEGHAKVADFGLAKRPGTDASVTATGAALGTPLYMPPEIARGLPLDARSDLYSLGATFYHLLAGRPPFEGATGAELILKHAEDTVPPLARAAPETPRTLCEIILRLLRKKPPDRFQSADELLQALAGVEPGGGAAPRGRPRRAGSAQPAGAHAGAPLQDGATVTVPGAAHPSLVERRDARQRQRRKSLVIGGIAAASAIVLVLVLVLVLGSSSRRPQATAPVPPETPSQVPRTPKTDHRQPLKSPLPEKAAPDTPAPKVNPWELAWREADAKAKSLAQESRYGDASKTYGALVDLFNDPRMSDRVQKAVAALHDQAEAAYGDAERRAKESLTAKKFDDARAALRPVLDRFGLPLKVEQAKKLLGEIETAEKAEGTAKAAKEATKEGEAEKKRLEAEAEKRRQADEGYAKAMEPVETLVAAWDFSAALASLPKVSAPSGGYSADLARRVATRRDELARLAALKAKFIAKINDKKPPLRKGSLFIPGANADLTKADDQGITAAPAEGKPELVPWPSLSSRSIQALTLQSIDRQSGDDWLAAGILLLALKDASAAEKHFDKAKELGAAIERYLDPLASAAFVQAKDLLDKKQFPEADAALAGLEKRYPKTPWFASHKADLSSAREVAKSGIAESEAEKLYADAAKLFERKELFDLKPLLEKLKTDYPQSRPVTDAVRKPTFAEMLKATETLGKFITVRQDGKGDFKSIQAAIDAAPPNSLVEIMDNGPYYERLIVAREGTTLRGKRGRWPVLASQAPNKAYKVLVEVGAPRVTMERLVLAHGALSADRSVCLHCRSGPFRLRSAAVCIALTGHQYREGQVYLSSQADSEAENCVFVGDGTADGRTVISNSLWKGFFWTSTGYQFHLRSCTVHGVVDGRYTDMPTEVLDSILENHWPGRKMRMENCDVFGAGAKLANGCFSVDPQFRDPANFDYRLKPTSPCRKKASDGGDIGCRFTPEMLEVLEKALELRRKGIIKF